MSRLLLLVLVACGGATTQALPPPPEAGPESCIKTPMAQACGTSCGSAPDGCGALWNCGTCPVCYSAPVVDCDPVQPGCAVQEVEGTPMCCCYQDGGQ